MGEGSSFASCIITQLRERNVKEHRFNDLIFHSNRLLESLDYLQKENLSRKLISHKSEDHPDSNPDSNKSDEISMLMKCCNLQKELAESHKKISEYALQIIDFKTQQDEKDKIITSLKYELKLSEDAIQKHFELNQNYVQQIDNLKKTLQNKIDECDTLNITYCSIENKKNDLDIENKILRNEVLMYKNKELAAEFSETVPIVVPKDCRAETNFNKKRSQSESDKQLQGTTPAKKPVAKAQSVDTTTKTIEKTKAQTSDPVLPATVKYEFNAHDSEVHCVSWVPSSPQLITAGADRKVKLWDMTEKSMELKKIVRDCNSAIMSVDLDIEAGLLLCASCDFASRVWTVNDFTIRHTLTGHSGKVMSAKFLPIENQIVSGSLDQTLKLWDLRRRACIQNCSTGSNINDVISKTGHTVISCHANGCVNFWDVRTNTITAHIACSAGVTSLDISKSGFLLLTSQLDNKLALIDLRKSKEVCSLFGSGFEVAYDWTRAKFSPDNQHCCCGSRNGCIFVWNLQSGTVTKELKAHTAPVIACSWSSCGSYLASSDSKKKCIIWHSK